MPFVFPIHKTEIVVEEVQFGKRADPKGESISQPNDEPIVHLPGDNEIDVSSIPF